MIGLLHQGALNTCFRAPWLHAEKCNYHAICRQLRYLLADNLIGYSIADNSFICMLSLQCLFFIVLVAMFIFAAWETHITKTIIGFVFCDLTLTLTLIILHIITRTSSSSCLLRVWKVIDHKPLLLCNLFQTGQNARLLIMIFMCLDAISVIGI